MAGDFWIDMIEYTAEYKIRQGYITFRIPDDYQILVNAEGEKCKGFMTVKFGKPRKPRTTGENSQNNLAWKLCTEIARALGIELYEVEYIAKVRAIKRGYPVVMTLGIPVPKSQANIDTVECGHLIDEYYMIAAENGIAVDN
jgi:hypothetical protein